MYVLVKQVTSKYLLSIFEVDLIGSKEQKTKSDLSNELHVLILEKDVIVVEEQELQNALIKAIFTFKTLQQTYQRKSSISCKMDNLHKDRSCHHPIQLLAIIQYYQSLPS